MLLTNFAEERGVKVDTIKKYIKRHESEFDGHIFHKGTKAELDEVAFIMLDEVYPHPKPVQVIQGVPNEEHKELLAKYEAVLEKYSKVQEELTRTTRELSLQEGRQMLLEEKDKRIDDIKGILEHSQDELKKTRQELEESKDELERLKNRNLWERITNKG